MTINDTKFDIAIANSGLSDMRVCIKCRTWGVSRDYPQLFSVHRLVAAAFIPNPLEKQEVNHIDEDIYNNRFDNLEWVTHRENIMSGTVQDRIDKGRSKSKKKVYQYDSEGNLLKEYDGCVDCEKYSFSPRAVAACCTSRQNT